MVPCLEIALFVFIVYLFVQPVGKTKIGLYPVEQMLCFEFY